MKTSNTERNEHRKVFLDNILSCLSSKLDCHVFNHEATVSTERTSFLIVIPYICPVQLNIAMENCRSGYTYTAEFRSGSTAQLLYHVHVSHMNAKNAELSTTEARILLDIINEDYIKFPSEFVSNCFLVAYEK